MEPAKKEAIILTHMLGRYLDDFGNVVRYLDADGYQVTIYASVPRDSGSLSIDSATLFDSYRASLPPSIEVKPLPYLRGMRMRPWDPFKMLALGFRLARQHPDAVFFLWSVAPLPFPYWIFFPAVALAMLAALGYVANLPLRL